MNWSSCSCTNWIANYTPVVLATQNSDFQELESLISRQAGASSAVSLWSVLFPLLLILILGGLGLIFRRVLGRTGPLVIKQFSIATSPRPTPSPTVEIVGRMQGIVAFILSLMGFSPITRFTIAGEELRCQSTSLFGEKLQCVPLRCVQTVSAGVHKPVSDLVIGAVLVLLGVIAAAAFRSWAPIAIGLLLGVLLVVKYILTKLFFIEVYAANGPPIALHFKPNVLEGVPIDVNRAMAVIGVIRDMVLNQGGKPIVSPAASSFPPTFPTAVPQPLESPPLTFPDSFEEIPEPLDNGNAAEELFEKARAHVKAGEKREAIAVLQEIVRDYPFSSYAEKARRNLAKSGIQVEE